MSRKISKRHLNGKGLEKLKLEYFVFMIKYFVHEKMILDVAKAYRTIFDTINKSDPELLKELDADGSKKNNSF